MEHSTDQAGSLLRRLPHVRAQIPERAFDLLRQRSTQIEQGVAQEITGIGTYRFVTSEALRASLVSNTEALIRAVRESDPHPTPDYMDELTQRTRERFDAGVRSDDLIRGYRAAMLSIQQSFAEVCESIGVGAEQLYAVFQIMLVQSDIMITHVSVQFQHYMLERQVADASRALVFVDRLLEGGMDPTHLAVECREHGLDPHGEFRVFFAWRNRGAEASGGVSERAASTVVMESLRGALGSGSLVVARRGLCVGLTPNRVPEIDAVNAAVGPALPLEAADRSAVLAEGTRAWMLGKGASGVVDHATPGWRLLIVTEPELTDAYLGSVVRPVEGRGASGRTILETVAAVIGDGRGVGATAARLFVHENTMRYRLKRFADLTGEDISRADSLVRVTWALAAAGYLD